VDRVVHIVKMNIGDFLAYQHIIILVVLVSYLRKKKESSKLIYLRVACGCHPYGSIRKDCLQDTGECSCHSFATGRQCNKCIDASFTLTDRGCVNCSYSENKMFLIN
jgi:hypothetical protein